MATVEAANIDLLVLDVDGVLTDGRITYDDTGRETKSFCVTDGSGLKYWHRSGKQSAIITGRESEAVARRAAELGVTAVRQKALDKLPALEEVLQQLGIAPERAAYMGDDLPDLPAMRAVGLKIAVPDAAEEVRQIADWISPVGGGRGAVRWAIERLLRESDLWPAVMRRYE